MLSMILYLLLRMIPKNLPKAHMLYIELINLGPKSEVNRNPLRSL